MSESNLTYKSTKRIWNHYLENKRSYQDTKITNPTNNMKWQHFRFTWQILEDTCNFYLGYASQLVGSISSNQHRGWLCKIRTLASLAYDLWYSNCIIFIANKYISYSSVQMYFNKTFCVGLTANLAAHQMPNSWLALLLPSSEWQLRSRIRVSIQDRALRRFSWLQTLMVVQSTTLNLLCSRDIF